MNRILLLLASLFCVINNYAQEKIVEKSYTTSANQPIDISFGFPSAKVSTWNKKEVYIKATVKINEGKYNDRFILVNKDENGKLYISDSLLDQKNMEPEYYVEINGVKTHFESKADYDNYRDAHKDDKISSYTNNNIDIKLEIMVPENANVAIHSKFGMVEVSNYTGPVNVTTQFGKIDVALNEAKVGDLKLTNGFGKIYSNFDVKPSEIDSSKRFHTVLVANPGKGPSCYLTSKFGNIYLRKAK